MSTPYWSMRRPLLLGAVTLLLLLGGFGLWATTTELSGAIVSPGRIEVELNRQIVQHPDGGVVAAIEVVEGASVRAGDVLIQLDGTLLQSDHALLRDQMQELAARRARLLAERDGLDAPSFPAELQALAAELPAMADLIDGQTRLFAARRATFTTTNDQLGRRIDQITAQIGGIDAQITALDSQLRLIRDELTAQRALLAKGLAQASAVLALEREEARLQGQAGEQHAARAQAEGRVTEIELEIVRLTGARIEEAERELREIGPLLMERAEKLAVVQERIARLDLRAPVSGVVLGLAVTTPRAVIRPADAVLYIVPQDRPLLITTQIPPIHVDQIYIGQPVELVFSAFSARDTPHLKGKVSVVSADAFTDPATHAAFYRAEILLDPGEIAKLGGQSLLPGMPVEAFIQTEARTPLAYLIKPFTDYFARAFRES
ncbi:HlyD family type I secretion periplasmic adaptor subunit [Xinfangfangia sp. CPCC 101601]|uniref:Membrane fusion protein (MFP) family protein n=1 Tax=Pseudogemmobacter lacusdianii TaxID=3069608 RepID=A0ABU0VYM8_9RHOB|nr:HlyD family type I secretion periplasmic adaptor subunit [Xinfangfangia sp. CPCC 101601]MDQ2066867.1 HlyD family type I secretion periplasmic adaptor subunit [Xinfangfangia sp. CPCC 101601]